VSGVNSESILVESVLIKVPQLPWAAVDSERQRLFPVKINFPFVVAENLFL
jgi:hypothetical protein